MLSNVLSFLPVSPEFLQAFSGGLLEMTKGIHGVSLSPDSLRLRASAAVFLLSFGGFSISGQILGVLRNVPISPFFPVIRQNTTGILFCAGFSMLLLSGRNTSTKSSSRIFHTYGNCFSDTLWAFVCSPAMQSIIGKTKVNYLLMRSS
ncbi:MAG: hypothetical protein V8Q36_10145 [Anaerotignum sp.]